MNVHDLQLAFDFHVQSQSQLTRQIVAMRDTAYAWIDSQLAVPGTQLFTVTSTTTNDCSNPTVHIWRRVAGTFSSPLFLTAVPGNTGAPQHSVDANDIPVQNGTMAAAFWMSVPCSVLDPGGPALYPLVLGHGLFGRGSDMIDGIPPSVTNALADPNSGVTGTWRYVAGATDWRGLSNQDLGWVANQVIGIGQNQFNNFPAFPDRLRQGMLNTLVLARLMKLGHFNVDPTFRTPDCARRLPGPERRGVLLRDQPRRDHGHLLRGPLARRREAARRRARDRLRSPAAALDPVLATSSSCSARSGSTSR